MKTGNPRMIRDTRVLQCMAERSVEIIRSLLPDAAQTSKIGDEELSQVKLKRSEFHGEWNYTIRPRKN